MLVDCVQANVKLPSVIYAGRHAACADVPKQCRLFVSKAMPGLVSPLK